MAKALSPLKLHRKNFGKIERIVDISNLIEMQKESYRRFLQKDVPPEAHRRFRADRRACRPADGHGRTHHPRADQRAIAGARPHLPPLAGRCETGVEDLYSVVPRGPGRATVRATVDTSAKI